MAGGPGDRWFRRRSGGLKAAATQPGREESPDTVLRHVDRSAFILPKGERETALECRAPDKVGINAARRYMGCTRLSGVHR